MMRKSWWVILSLTFAFLGATSALADTISFTGTGLLPTSGSFTYDNTTTQFTSFQVVWDGITFDLLSSANSPQIIGGGPACIGGQTGPVATLTFLTTSCPPPTGEFQWAASFGGTGGPALFTMSAQDASGNSISIDEVLPYAAVVVSASPLPVDRAAAQGDFTDPAPPPTATPEPATNALMLVGVGLGLVMRKRIGQALQTSSMATPHSL
jgi:hypothetical protein